MQERGAAFSLTCRHASVSIKRHHLDARVRPWTLQRRGYRCGQRTRPENWLVTATSRVELWFPRMMHGSEVAMTSDPRRKIDELASELDDLTTTVEELEIEATNEADAAELRRLQRALEEASDAADVVDDKMDDEDA